MDTNYARPLDAGSESRAGTAQRRQSPTDSTRPVFQSRSVDPAIEGAAIEAGAHPLAARVLAGRPIPPGTRMDALLSPGLKHLDSPWRLADMEPASNRIAAGIVAGDYFAIETDFDCDGQTSHAVIRVALTQYFGVPDERIGAYISERLTEGYGLTDPVADRILADAGKQPAKTLVITADNGSSDAPRITRLKAADIDVIVTDHHEIPAEGVPADAYAVINPTRNDCDFPDKTIAGCMVAWYLMCAVRVQLIRRGHLPENTPKLGGLLPYVAAGTVADCVSMASTNNRAVVMAGLQAINRSDAPVLWHAIRKLIQGNRVAPDDLAFKVGPMLNAASRVASVSDGINFLLSRNMNDAEHWAQALERANEDRKAIEREITEIAMAQAVEQVEQGRHGVVAYEQGFHSGVVGICASRIKEKTGRPAVVFADPQGRGKCREPSGTAEALDDPLITGSARGIDYAPFHVRDALQWIADNNPGMILKFGGHKGAGGLTIRKRDLDRFRDAFDQAVAVQIETPRPVVLTDGSLNEFAINIDLYHAIEDLAPFGQGFARPIFELDVTVVKTSPLGAGGIHLKARCLTEEGQFLDAIWWRARSDSREPFPLLPNQRYRMAVTLNRNEWRGQENLQLFVQAAVEI